MKNLTNEQIESINQTSFTYQKTTDNLAYQVNAKIIYKKDLFLYL